MRISYLIVIAVIICTQGFAFSPSWHKYYNHINNAEQLICKGEYRAAYQQYKMAYTINDTSIANVDLYNSFHVGMIVKDTAFAKKQLCVLLRRGLSEKFINSNILKYYSTPHKQYIQHWIDLYKYDTIIPSETALQIQRLVEEDQGVRTYSIHQNNGNVGTDTVNKVDIKVQKELLDILQKQLLNSGSIENRNVNPFYGTGYSIIIVHNVQAAEMKKTDFLFWEIINKGLEQFSFTPNDVLLFAVLGPHVVAQKYMGANEPLMFDCVGYNDSLFVPKINKSKITQINAIRQKYGLCTIEEEIAKINYTNKTSGKGRFLISSQKRILDTEEKDQLDEWLKKTIYPN